MKMKDLMKYRMCDEDGRIYLLFNNIRPRLMILLVFACLVALA